jgi:hypothetical protein
MGFEIGFDFRNGKVLGMKVPYHLGFGKVGWVVKKGGD